MDTGPGADGGTQNVTIYDVARECGVAASTVSRAFSRPGRVSAATYERVMEAAGRLGYRTAAPRTQALTERKGRIAVDLPDITNPYFAEVIRGMQEAAHAADYLLFVVDSVESHDRERSGLERSLDAVDGIVLCGSRVSDAVVTQLRKLRPVMVLNRRVAGIDSLTPDYEHAMVQVMTHLRATGVQEVVYIAGPVNSWSDAERWRSARIVAENVGVAIRRVGPFPPTAAGGEEAYLRLRRSLPEAVVAYNDLIGMGLLVAALRDGVDVPGAFQVVAHDDIAMARLVGRGLTTVASPKNLQGRAAIERLIGLIETPARAGRPVEGSLPVKLVPRGSTRPVTP
ncbi:MAG: LacI family DNA-binding transcriptional regulator [Brachybacterium sp.]|nr:LacI family DNA-binding transcriptional regulator [Brachybacterium sp.]